MKRTITIIIGICLIALSANSVFAVNGGNPKKGKFLYKKNCKVCHTADAEAGLVTPLSKTMRQWDRFFEKDAHKSKPEVFNDLSSKDIKDIRQFLYDHAVDSPSPQTCG